MKQQPQLIDIRKVRKALGRTYQQYGRQLSIHYYGFDGKPIPAHRILEWEKNSRPVPTGIYRACVKTVADEWARRRQEASCDCHARIDEYYSKLISPAFGSLFASLAEDMTAYTEIRKAFVEHVRQTFGFDISYVWE